jgi:hypothetical protein
MRYRVPSPSTAILAQRSGIVTHVHPARLATGRKRGFLACLAAIALLPGAACAQAVRVDSIAPGYYLHTHASGNLLLYADSGASMVAGVQAPELVASVRETIRARALAPVKYALLMESDSAPGYGDGGWGREGAVTLSHEMMQVRMERRAQPRRGTAIPLPPGAALPALSFSQVLQVYLPREEVHFIYERPGYTDADLIVHFENAGLLYLGNILTTDGYPQVDTTRDGDVAGMIATADFFLTTFAERQAKVEPIVPGRGPVTDMAGLREFRDMLVAVRDRVQALRAEGRSLDEVIAARPTAAFDARWGRGPVSPDRFVGMVYYSVVRAERRRPRT